MTLDQQEPPRALSAAQPQNPAPRAGEHSLPSDFHSTTERNTFQKHIKHAVNAVCPEERQQARRMAVSTSDAAMEGIGVDQGPPHPLCSLTPPCNLPRGASFGCSVRSLLPRTLGRPGRRLLPSTAPARPPAICFPNQMQSDRWRRRGFYSKPADGN